MFSCKLGRIFKNSYCAELLRTAASEELTNSFHCSQFAEWIKHFTILVLLLELSCSLTLANTFKPLMPGGNKKVTHT